MPAPKRRKVAAAAVSTSSTVPRGLDSFARVSRQTATSKELEKTAASSPVSDGTHDGAKRKRQGEKIEQDGDAAANETRAPAVASRAIRPLPVTRRSTYSSQRPPVTPKKRVSPPTRQVSVEATPSKEACDLFSRFGLAKSSPTHFDSSPLQKESSVFDDCSEIKSSQVSVEPGLPDEDFPPEVLDLIDLHASFLNALSLHYAHNGTHSPADLRKLCPDSASIWGKRGVTLEDIRRTLGVLNSRVETSLSQAERSPTLILSSYGLNKICIEFESIESSYSKKGLSARPLDEKRLNARYTKNLASLWEERDLSSGVGDFISNLPLQAIINCSSLDKMSPSLAKGQRRLQELKANLTLKKETTAAKKLTPISSSPDSKIEGRESPLKRQSSLLERIRAKQLHQSTLPPPPSAASIARTSALHRLEEIVSVITLLSTSGSAGQQRVSFTIPTVIGKLKDSMRMPISMEEGKLALDLLAGEVAPEWVKVIGGFGRKVGAIVVDRERRLENEIVEERISVALGRSEA